MKKVHSFSIENTKTDPDRTDSPVFGSKYAGTFSIRRPSLQDKNTINLHEAASLSAAGHVNPALISGRTRLTAQIFASIAVLSEQSPPAWFDMDQMYDETDEDAVLAVWAEVQKFVDSFRSSAAGDTGTTAGTGAPLLVPA